ncbi:MAG: hypothetical protein NTZ73_02305 [Candidatus Diapherotrites archaeon]|nr:hypothetical protein [Candidatus Diapherotrites archaeon]
MLKYWRYALVIGVVLISIIFIAIFGIRLGIDFKGGTLYQVELANQISSEEIARVANIISQRMDPGGLRGDSVSPVGGQFILIQTTETDQIELEKIEARIRQQGRFEATLNGETIFTGDEIKSVLRGSTTYGIYSAGGKAVGWRMPFVLSETAAKRFMEKTFHQCDVSSIGTNGKPVYECAKTYFFLDKPNALLVISEEQYDVDSESLNVGNSFADISQGTDIKTLVENAQLPLIIYSNPSDSNSGASIGLDENILSFALLKTSDAIVSPGIGDNVVNALKAKGFNVTKEEIKKDVPWLWSVTKAKQVISLTENVTNEDVSDISKAEMFTTLVITGTRSSAEVAKTDLEELTILLESGSLPTPVKSISRETISPSLGASFLNELFLMGVIALVAVAAFIVLRYKTILLAIPIFATVVAETIILFGFLALTRNPLDLAAFAGLIAALGSGVNSEVVITDEITRKSEVVQESTLQRVKSALFIITTSTITIVGVMGPIVLLSRSFPGMEKLYGFAIIAIFGSVAGVLFTRPAFTKIVEKVVTMKEKKESS